MLFPCLVDSISIDCSSKKMFIFSLNLHQEFHSRVYFEPYTIVLFSPWTQDETEPQNTKQCMPREQILQNNDWQLCTLTSMFMLLCSF